MDEQQRALLAVAARLTDYPADSFREELEEIRAFMTGHFPMGPIRFAVAAGVDELGALSLQEARECYVAVFDLKDRTSLYLTAHELGDSRKRGIALIELRHLLQASGLEPQGGQLPDYIPMLYEWAAEVPQSAARQKLLERLAFATQRIRGNLAEDNPWKLLFEVLMTVVFEERSEASMNELERFREKPDLDPMPFPLLYK